ncbi:hypothetical protein L3049_16345 [Labilibaculum sp. DW002]|uniref:Lipoprotein n=1 Tax=Paralabilibaculum antarcticum TaxID=2912572 RepID=A0ABT5VWD3_9BACT|nr:hypothetical protein [Labilibaculum sp. DW002]MDE5419565.1 hypothetical protein [Labilibaculum sp. DW002]
MQRINYKVSTFLILISVLFSCEKIPTDNKEVYYRVVNSIIQDHQNMFKGVLIVGDQDTVNFRTFDLGISPYEKFKFSTKDGNSSLQFSNTYRQLHLNTFPTLQMKQSYNHKKDSSLIPKWDSLRINKCRVVQFDNILENQKHMDDYFRAMDHRYQKDILLLSHPLFNKEKDTATIASVLFTKNYIIQSFTDCAISDTTITPFYKLKFLNRIETETKYYENSKRDEITAVIFRGSWEE